MVNSQFSIFYQVIMYANLGRLGVTHQIDSINLIIGNQIAHSIRKKYPGTIFSIQLFITLLPFSGQFQLIKNLLLRRMLTFIIDTKTRNMGKMNQYRSGLSSIQNIGHKWLTLSFYTMPAWRHTGTLLCMTCENNTHVYIDRVWLKTPIQNFR